eukprot:CAMPEP_0174265200 /NCGR_PEP_ID=MMETSP0439-20130205/25557_1 /TAXON_ID=0 /ORGANISM="Stereomyxa ramosa, Strain Chinc5" /LENGTH=351 /DNA_ID=CAMNT_0015351525 /DNA_START=1 /DNA_END=1056 /DNA_ORIENTATION=+
MEEGRRKRKMKGRGETGSKVAREDTLLTHSPRFYFNAERLQIKQTNKAVLATSFNPPGDLLAAADSRGQIHLWQTNQIFSGSGERTSYEGHSGSVYSLCWNSEELLLSGGVDGIACWKVGTEEPDNCFRINTASLQKEVNHIQLHEGKIYCAMGDGKCHVWDLQTQQHLHHFTGHHDYLHSLLLRPLHQQLITASEDDQIRLWDLRDHSMIEVLSGSNLRKGEARRKGGNGKWVSCLLLDPTQDWLISGHGGGYGIKWHLPSYTPTHALPTGYDIYSLAHYNHEILTGGGCSQIHRWRFGSCEFKSTMQTSIASVLSISSSKEKEVFCCSGTSNMIDVFSHSGQLPITLHS